MRLVLLLCLIFSNSPAIADVADGGWSHSEEVKDQNALFGGSAGALLPAEEFPFNDRQESAPVDTSLFIVGKDQKCHPGHFRVSEADNFKTLVVEEKQTVSLDNCIYQKSRTNEAAGFSLFQVGGGVCKPTYSSNPNDLKKNASSLKVVNKVVAIRHCTDHTVSLGEKLPPSERKVSEVTMATPAPTVAPTPKPKVIPVAMPTPAAKIIARPVATAAPTPMPTASAKPGVMVKPLPSTPISKDVVNFAMPSQIEAKPTATPARTRDRIPEVVTWPVATHVAKPVATAAPTPTLSAKAKPTVMAKPAASATTKKVAVKLTKPKEEPAEVDYVHHKYTVQVAATTNQKGADKLVSGLKKTQSEPVFTFDAEVNSENYHRVCIGLFDTARDARDFIKQSEATLGSMHPFVQVLPKD